MNRQPLQGLSPAPTDQRWTATHAPDRPPRRPGETLHLLPRRLQASLPQMTPAASRTLPAATRSASGRPLTPPALSDAAHRQPTRDEKQRSTPAPALDPTPLLQG